MLKRTHTGTALHTKTIHTHNYSLVTVYKSQPQLGRCQKTDWLKVCSPCSHWHCNLAWLAGWQLLYYSYTQAAALLRLYVGFERLLHPPPLTHSGFDRHEIAPLLRLLLRLARTDALVQTHTGTTCKQVQVHVKLSMCAHHIYKCVHVFMYAWLHWHIHRATCTYRLL